ncbi:ZmpA/ZmpB/ZmpC family metallo-endopeptidase [Enterococcus hirae]
MKKHKFISVVLLSCIPLCFFANEDVIDAFEKKDFQIMRTNSTKYKHIDNKNINSNHKIEVFPYIIHNDSWITGTFSGIQVKKIGIVINGIQQKIVSLPLECINKQSFQYYVGSTINSTNDKIQVILYDEQTNELVKKNVTITNSKATFEDLKPYVIGQDNWIKGMYKGLPATYIDVEINKNSLGIVSSTNLEKGVFNYYVGSQVKLSDKIEAVLYNNNWQEIARSFVTIDGEPTEIISIDPYTVGYNDWILGNCKGKSARFIDVELNGKKLGLVSSDELNNGIIKYYIGKKLTSIDNLNIILYDYNYNEIIREKIPQNKSISIIQSTKTILQQVEFYSNKKIEDLLKIRHRFSEINSKKIEIMKQTGKKFTDITDEEAIDELNKEILKQSSYENAFKIVQNNIDNLLQQLLINSYKPTNNKEDDTTYFVKKITENKEEILLGLAYLERLYNIPINNINLKEKLLQIPNVNKQDKLDWIISIGKSGGESLKLSNNCKTFQKLIGNNHVISEKNVTDFIENNLKNSDVNTWFKNTSKAYIVEGTESNITTGEKRIYHKLKENTVYQNHILPLLTVSENSIYAISNSVGITYGLVDTYCNREKAGSDEYKNKIEKFKKQLNKINEEQSSFIDFWHRILKKDQIKQKLNNTVIMIEGHIVTNDNPKSTIREMWSPKNGEQASIGVKEFIFPMNLYRDYFHSNGVAEGNTIRLYLSKALEDNGLETYAHELTHIYISNIFLEGNSVRDGFSGEFYPRGLLEPFASKEPPILNLNTIYNRTSNFEAYTTNSIPARFQQEKDIKEYMNHYFDVLYTLDYIEAEVILNKNTSTKKKWFNRLEQIKDLSTNKRNVKTGETYQHTLDEFKKLTFDEAAKLTNINQLVEQNIVAARYEIGDACGRSGIGIARNNGYYTISMYTPIYASATNSCGVSGDIISRRHGYEILAEYGYHDGLIPYISNQLKDQAMKNGVLLSDKYIINQISGGKYDDFSSFKKEMFRRRINNLDKLKTISITKDGKPYLVDSYEKMKQLMEEAVTKDLNNPRADVDEQYWKLFPYQTEVEKLKDSIFKSYLKITNEFSTSIYQTP